MSGVITAAAITAIVSASVAVSAQMQQASAAKASAKFQSQVAADNQNIATQNAQMAAAAGEAKAAKSEQQTRTAIGAELASQGSSGVDINSESSTDVRRSTAEVGALDAQTIRSNAAREAYGYETQSNNFANQASADTSQGVNDSTAGYVKAAGGLLTSASNAGFNYANTMNKSSGVGGTTPTQNSAAYDASLSGSGSAYPE